MARSLPPVKWLQAFEAAARHLSFTRAADEIGLTQSAVSQQIKSLELRLGATLFLRNPNGLALTDSGRRLLPQVGAALELLQASTLAFDAAPDEAMLTIATSVSVAQWVIAPKLPEFQALHPDLRLRFVSAIWPDDFVSAVADVEIRFGSERQVGLHAAPLRPGNLIALKSPALSGPLEILPLIEAVGTSVGWDAFGAAHGLTGLRPVMFVDSYGMALNLATNGSGVALVSALLGREAIDRGLLTSAHPGSIAAREGYYVSIRERIPAARQFRDWLNRHLAPEK